MDVIAGQIAWWCDELEDWQHEQVVYALRKWNMDNPDKRPTPGHIVAILKRTRGMAEAKRRREREFRQHYQQRTEPRVTPEQAARILAEAGIDLNAPTAKPFPEVGENG